MHFGVTRNPTDAWLAQQLREATPFAQGPGYLIRDNDRKYGRLFARVASGTGIEVLRKPYGAPKANAICERFLGSVRRECLDHFLSVGERHLRRVMKEYGELLEGTYVETVVGYTPQPVVTEGEFLVSRLSRNKSISGPQLDLEVASAIIPVNGSTAVTATVRDGLAVITEIQRITFTASLGTVNPAVVDTVDGVATTVFTAGSVPGTAVITATNGSLISQAFIQVRTPDDGRDHLIYLPVVLRNR